jgi:hypothetical protein
MTDKQERKHLLETKLEKKKELLLKVLKKHKFSAQSKEQKNSSWNKNIAVTKCYAIFVKDSSF